MQILKIASCKYNPLFPSILGYKYLDYKNNRIRKNYHDFDASLEVINLVNHAIKSVPYYKKKYRLPFKNLSEFTGLFGFIDREEVMYNWNDFLHEDIDKSKIITGTTGGTSGKPMKLVLPRDRYVFELATIYSMWANVGWKGQTRGVIRNHHLKEGQVFDVNPIKKEIIFDGFRTSDYYYHALYQVLKKTKISYIHAYPSSAYQFAEFLLKEKLDVSFFKAFLCGSEGVLPEQKVLIENKLGIKMYNWYGHSEKLILGGYCQGSDLFHIEPTYGYFELIDGDSNPINKPGLIGEIVGTTLHNPYMPLIRYKTGDYAEYAGNYCPYCNRHLPLLKKIYGRWDKNKIYRKDGSYITTTALNLHTNIYTKLFGIQYIQTIPGKLLVSIIKGDHFTNEDLDYLKYHYNTAFGQGNNVEIEFVKQLRKLPNGKFQILISEI